jgi:YesN/AraC family two-component response regulator
MVKKKHTLYGSEQMLRSLIELFLIGLIRKYEFFENSDETPTSTFTIKEIIEYLDNTFTEKITLEELAFLFRTNRSTLCKEFRRATNKSLGEYLADKKIEAAKKLLSQKEKSITQIADELHFDSVPYFCEFFKRQTGQTPSEYRQKGLSLDL